jgi:hypothetical protein
MAYLSTDWKTGDKITAPRLNNVETGLQNIAETVEAKANIIKGESPIEWRWSDIAPDNRLIIAAGRRLRFDTSKSPVPGGVEFSQFVAMDASDDALFGWYEDISGRVVIGQFRIESDYVDVDAVYDSDAGGWRNGGVYQLQRELNAGTMQSVVGDALEGFNMDTDVSVISTPDADLSDVRDALDAKIVSVVETEFLPEYFGSVGQYAITPTGRILKKITITPGHNITITADFVYLNIGAEMSGNWTYHGPEEAITTARAEEGWTYNIPDPDKPWYSKGEDGLIWHSDGRWCFKIQNSTLDWGMGTYVAYSLSDSDTPITGSWKDNDSFNIFSVTAEETGEPVDEVWVKISKPAAGLIFQYRGGNLPSDHFGEEGQFALTDNNILCYKGKTGNTGESDTLELRVKDGYDDWNIAGLYFDQGVNTVDCAVGAANGSRWFLKESNDKCLCWYENAGWVIWNDPQPQTVTPDGNCLRQVESDPVVYCMPPVVSAFESWTAGGSGGVRDVVFGSSPWSRLGVLAPLPPEESGDFVLHFQNGYTSWIAQQ